VTGVQTCALPISEGASSPALQGYDSIMGFEREVS
jgi:hypothetical protein